MPTTTPTETATQRLQRAILETPSGPARDALMEVNLLRMSETDALKASHAELLATCRNARSLYDHLSLSALEAAAKYGPDYQPPTDQDWLDMRAQLETAIANAEKVQS